MDKAAEILKKVHRIQLRGRKLAAENFAGNYQSGLRGQGLDFDDFREYLSGDEPRFIDWKVTARMGTPYVRRFKEEREQALILLIDASASMRYASAGSTRSKLDYAAEIAAVLAFSAATSGDKCGLLLTGVPGDRLYLPPTKGVKQTLRIIREIVGSEPGGRDDSLSDTADHLLRTQKKQAMVVFMSDFLMPTDRLALGKLSFKHELIPIRIQDPMETALPDAGRVIIRDPETNHPMYFNLSRPDVLAAHTHAMTNHRNNWKKEFTRLGLDFLDLSNREPFLTPLKALFTRRSRHFTR